MLGKDDGEGILCDLGSESPVLAITFGGLLMRVGMMPPFEFFNIMSRSAPAKKIFVRDHWQAWYHRGVRDVAADIEGVETSLRRIRDEQRPAKVVTLGTSAGGYAALLFGYLLGATEIHAFSPQTFISPELRARYGDTRWDKQWSALIRSGRFQARFGDLAELFDADPSVNTRCFIHYSRNDPLGSIHAKRLASHSGGVELRDYGLEGRNVVQHLRECGELGGLLHKALAV